MRFKISCSCYKIRITGRKSGRWEFNIPPKRTKTAPLYSGTSGFADYWVLKIDASGRREWDQSYGGNSYDNLDAILPIGGGDFLLGGNSASATNSNKTVLSSGDSDWWVLRITGTNPPAITNQPQGGTFTAGETVNLGIGVESFTRAIFQWRRNGEDLPGQTNSILSLVAIDSADAKISPASLATRYSN